MWNDKITLFIGILAGAIFFIDGWGPSEKGKSFLESRRFRGLSVIITGGIIAPVLDYVTKAQQPLFFLSYLKGTFIGWTSVFSFSLFVFMLWKITRNLNPGTNWYKIGQFANAVLDFIYLGIADNPHLDAQRKFDLDEDGIQYQYKLDRLKKELDENKINPITIKSETDPKMVEEYNKKLSEYTQTLDTSKKTEEEYTFDDWYLKGIAAYSSKEYEKTIAYMKNALEKDTKNENSPDAYLYIGIGYDEIGLHNKSIEQYDKIISDYPIYNSMYLVHNNKGVSYQNLGDYNSALLEGDKSIELNNQFEFPWNNKGVVLMKQEKFQEALVALDQSIKLNPAFFQTWYNKACVHSLLKDKSNMLISLKKAIELNKEYKNSATKDEDFKAYWTDADFKKLVE